MLEPKYQRAGLLPAVTLQLAPQPSTLLPHATLASIAFTTLLCYNMHAAYGSEQQLHLPRRHGDLVAIPIPQSS